MLELWRFLPLQLSVAGCPTAVVDRWCRCGACRNGRARGAQDVRLAQECVDARLTGFPAWIINGRTLSGARTLDELEAELRQAPAPAPALAGQ